MTQKHMTQFAELQLQTQYLKEVVASSQKLEFWTTEKAQAILTQLEQPNWAPWLAAGVESLAGRAIVNPEGQFLLAAEDGGLIASLSTNKINWGGNPEILPTWDEVAGDPTTYEQTYCPRRKHNGAHVNEC